MAPPLIAGGQRTRNWAPGPYSGGLPARASRGRGVTVRPSETRGGRRPEACEARPVSQLAFRSGSPQANQRNGTSGKTVITDEGPVRIEVPQNREGSFEPQIKGA